MSYQVLARKWRPANFQQMVGQEHVVQALVNALDGNRLHHAYLFSGTRGVGKTTVARIFAKSLNCERGISAQPCGECASCNEIDEGRSVDLIEIDAASRTGVDDMRELLDNVQYAPTRGRFKIYLIDEVHMLSRHSFNALLKTLEEPPDHIKFLLATTDPQKVPVTVLSRCLQFSLKRMSREQILSHLQYLTEQESIETEAAALAQLAGAADGSMRDALSLLDQAIGYGGGAVMLSAVEPMLGSLSHDNLLRLLEALSQQDASSLLREARGVIEHNPDYQRVCADMIELLQSTALYQADSRLVAEASFDAELLESFAARWSAEEIQLYYQILLQGRQDLLIAPDAAAGFEMLMLRLFAFVPENETLSEPAALKKKPEIKPEVVTEAPSKAVSDIAHPVAADDDSPQPVFSNWATLVYELGLDGLAQEIVANSVAKSFDDNRLQLVLPAEIQELLNDVNQDEIQQALEQKLGVSLSLDWQAGETLPGTTPLQAREDRRQQEREAAIDAIREDAVVKKLQTVLAAELDEASVVKIENNGNGEVRS